MWAKFGGGAGARLGRLQQAPTTAAPRSYSVRRIIREAERRRALYRGAQLLHHSAADVYLVLTAGVSLTESMTDFQPP